MQSLLFRPISRPGVISVVHNFTGCRGIYNLGLPSNLWRSHRCRSLSSTTKLPYNPDGPLNDLERALQNAAKDPMARPIFYRALLTSDVYYLTSGDGRSVFQWAFSADPEQPENTDQPDQEAQILKIPVFTSMERAAEEMLMQQQEPQKVGKTTGRTILEMAAQNDYTVWLTAGQLGCGKDFLPHECASMVAETSNDETGNNNNPNQVTFQAGSEFFLGQPAEYPSELVEFLKRIFSERPHVRAAYLARLVQSSSPSISDQQQQQQQHRNGDALVGIEVDRMPLDEEMMQGIVEWVQDQVPGKVYDFDAWAVDDETAVSSRLRKYMKEETQPFYVAPPPSPEDEKTKK